MGTQLPVPTELGAAARSGWGSGGLCLVPTLSLLCPPSCLGSCFALSPSLPCPCLSFNSQFLSPSSLSRPCPRPCFIPVPTSAPSTPHVPIPACPHRCLRWLLSPGTAGTCCVGLAAGSGGAAGPGSTPRPPYAPLDPLRGAAEPEQDRASGGTGGRSYLRLGEQSLQNRDVFEKGRDAFLAERRSPAATGKYLR